MYLEKLTIKGFRCFAHATMDFNWPGYAKLAGVKALRLPNVNLLIGDNGTGKTTLFQALTIALLRSYLADNVSGFRTPMAIRHGEETAEAFAGALLSPLDTAQYPDEAVSNVLIAAKTVRGTIRRKGSLQSLVSGSMPKDWRRTLFLDEHPGCFIAAYGAGRRTERAEAYLDRKLGVRYRRVASLFEPYIGLIPLSLAYTQCTQRSRWMEVVDIVNNILQPPVQLTQKTDERGEPLFDYEGILLPIAELSDGYRLFSGWLIDCLTQLAWVLPPKMTLREAVGIVIVDEVDLFLSPIWQRTALEYLSKEFPQIQWFCSTHSPLVAGSLENENIYILERETPYTSKIRRPTDEFEGKSVEKVLMELFGVLQPRSTELQRQLSDLAERAMNGDVDASIQYLRRLHQGTAKQ
ncbi:MAG: AAA family ATPase [Armatimonadetes bacterium]|nr:AAA family ATPase [Armatimonadota bacterium]